VFITSSKRALHITKCEWTSPDTSWTDKRPAREERAGSSTFVLPVITSMCTYNNGALNWGYWVGLNPFTGFANVGILAFQVSYNLDKLKGLLFEIQGIKLWLNGRFGCSTYKVLCQLLVFCLQNYQGYIASSLVNRFNSL
jgi:hypothetical protein